MNGEIGNVVSVGDVGDDVSTDEPEDTVVLSDDDVDVDNVGDISVEINVEELVAKLEAANNDDVTRKREIRRRIEELREEQEVDLDSTFNFRLDED